VKVIAVTAAAAAGFFVASAPAWAVAPSLSNVSYSKRHPTAAVAAPRASSVTVYMASRPDRATDGSFLSEHVKEIDFLTDQEIQTGSWLYESAIDPGAWYLMAKAIPDSSCYSYPPPDYKEVIDPTCANGFSTVVALTILKPPSRYRAEVEVFRYIGVAYLTLRANPLGEDRPYKACWRLKNKRRMCVRGRLDGYDWDSAASDLLRVNTRGMARVTTFTWYVGARTVATKRVRVR
jgi:hypothetical protein